MHFLAGCVPSKSSLRCHSSNLNRGHKVSVNLHSSKPWDMFVEQQLPFNKLMLCQPLGYMLNNHHFPVTPSSLFPRQPGMTVPCSRGCHATMQSPHCSLLQYSLVTVSNLPKSAGGHHYYTGGWGWGRCAVWWWQGAAGVWGGEWKVPCSRLQSQLVGDRVGICQHEQPLNHYRYSSWESTVCMLICINAGRTYKEGSQQFYPWVLKVWGNFPPLWFSVFFLNFLHKHELLF